MSSHAFQEVLAVLVHILMLCYYWPKVVSGFPKLNAIWNRFVTLFQRFTPAKHRQSTGGLLSGSLLSLTNDERLPIFAAAVALNALGMAISLAFPSMVYLDMVGTAVAAFLLGPWYGAVVACATSGIVNFSLFSVDCFPWVVVNVTGAAFWGVMGSMSWFKAAPNSKAPSAASVPLVLVGGVLCAFVLAFPGTITQVGLGPSYRNSLAFSSDLAASLDRVINMIETGIAGTWLERLGSVLGITPNHMALYLCNVLRYIPDKTITVVVAVLCIRTIFPVYWELLVRARPEHARVFMLPRQPFLFSLAYALILFAHHELSAAARQQPESFGPSLPNHTPVYIILLIAPPVLGLLSWIVGLCGWHMTADEIRSTCVRAKTYQLCHFGTSEPHDDLLDSRGVLATLVFAVVFSLGLICVDWIAGSSASGASVWAAFRSLSAITIAIVFVLKFARAAVVQHQVMPHVSARMHDAQLFVDEAMSNGEGQMPPVKTGKGAVDNALTPVNGRADQQQTKSPDETT
ncbi:MAG: hypothetical protein HUU19_01725 [Phycisphaerales bacterium]|nr:hypothetical protein [Phycisphaerales bacterium]